MRVTLFLSIILFLSSCGPSAQDYISDGIVKMDSTDFVGAIADFTNALEIDEENELAYIKRGEAKEQIGLIEEAIGDWEMALKINPRNDSVYVKEAIAYRKLELYPKAESALKIALSINDKNTTAIFEQGNTYFDQEEYELAISNYEKTLAIDSTNMHAHFNIGAAYSNKGKLDAAKDYYQSARDNGYPDSIIQSRLDEIEKSKRKQRQISANTFSCGWCNKKVYKTNAYGVGGDHYSTYSGMYDIEMTIEMEKVMRTNLGLRPTIEIFCSRSCAVNYARSN